MKTKHKKFNPATVPPKPEIHNVSVKELKTDIRPVTVKELLVVASHLPVFFKEFGGPYQYDEDRFIIAWIEWLKLPTHTLFGAFENDKWIGSLGGYVWVHPWTKDQILGEELFWYVLPEYRISGVGGKLYSAFVSWLHEKKAEYLLMLYAHGRSPDSVKQFYKKQGFTIFESTVIKRIGVKEDGASSR